MTKKGRPIVGFRLSAEDIAALKALAGPRPVSEVLREMLEGEEGVAGIPLAAVKLDLHLVELDNKARSEAYFEVDKRLGRLGDAGIAELEKELRAAQAIRREMHGEQNFLNAQRRIQELESLLEELRALRTKAESLIPAKCRDLKLKEDLDPVADVQGGSLMAAIENAVTAQKNYERLAQKYRYVPEKASEVEEAKQRADQARSKLETLTNRYLAALELQRQRKADREKAKELERQKARESLRPLAEEAFRLYVDLVSALVAVKHDWATHPKLEEICRLAKELRTTAEAFNSAVSIAGELDRYGYVTPPVQEMLRHLRERLPEVPAVEKDVEILLAWVFSPKLRFDRNGVPWVEPPEPQKEREVKHENP